MSSKSPFARPSKNLRIKEGSPPLLRPTKEEIASFPSEASSLVQSNISIQHSLISQNNYNIEQLKGRHFLLAGATGQGLGCSLASSILELVKEEGSLTIISRDLKRSLGFETGNVLQNIANNTGIADRFFWSNNGLALEANAFELIINKLKEFKANNIIYINTVASASSGTLPGQTPVFVKDLDNEGLFEWKLLPLREKEIETTKLFMGTMAVDFPHKLEEHNINVDLRVFADWRGSLDKISRDPNSIYYGRQGAYSTSLYLPKDILQDAVSNYYGTSTKAISIFFPIMRTRALGFIPGGNTMASVFNKLMNRLGLKWTEVPELAMLALEAMNRSLTKEDDNPFPRLDSDEVKLELWFYEVVKQINNDENSKFYYKNWI